MPALSLNFKTILAAGSDGYVAYDIRRNRLFELNPAAALLLELCNGSRTAEEVVALAAPHLPKDSCSSSLRWLEQAAKEGLLVQTDGVESDATIRPTVDELTAEADRLRDEGAVQAAWICQQEAACIQPNNPTILRDLGELAHITGQRQQAREAYRRYLELNPQDAEIRHLLTSLNDEAAPPRVPDTCIQQLYERFAGFYEQNMVDQLGYQGPIHLRAVLEASLQHRSLLSVLDLGCGTGLAGKQVSQVASELTGVDLSPHMIETARQHQIYDHLHVAEVTQWLEQSDSVFDLILACDTLIYFGDLSQVLAPAARRLAPDGVMGFSVERSETPGFQLTDNGRYVHHSDHIADAVARAGLKIVEQNVAFLRMEYGEPVNGIFTCVTRA